MFTYQFILVNDDNCQKNVFVCGNSYFDALNNIKNDYGNSWSVYSYKLVSSVFN